MSDFKKTIIAALTHADVQEILLTTLIAGIELVVKELVVKRFDKLSATIALIKTEITQHIAENAQLCEENADLKKNCQELSEKCDFLENYQCCDNLILVGLPFVNAADAATDHSESHLVI